jgi:hypothetical protein
LIGDITALHGKRQISAGPSLTCAPGDVRQPADGSPCGCSVVNAITSSRASARPLLVLSGSQTTEKSSNPPLLSPQNSPWRKRDMNGLLSAIAKSGRLR